MSPLFSSRGLCCAYYRTSLAANQAQSTHASRASFPKEKTPAVTWRSKDPSSQEYLSGKQKELAPSGNHKRKMLGYAHDMRFNKGNRSGYGRNMLRYEETAVGHLDWPPPTLKAV